MYKVVIFFLRKGLEHNMNCFTWCKCRGRPGHTLDTPVTCNYAQGQIFTEQAQIKQIKCGALKHSMRFSADPLRIRLHSCTKSDIQ